MKKVFLVLFISAFVLSFNACNSKDDDKEKTDKEDVEASGPEKDIDKMLEIVEEATAYMEEAVEDEIIDEGEARKINNANKELTEFTDELEEKYKDDEEALAAQEEIYEEREDEIQEVIEAYIAASMEVMSCEGADLIDVD